MSNKNIKRIYSPIRYAGGKTKAAKVIADYIPSDTKKIISPFLGGASLEIFLANTRDIEIIGYDIFQPLVEFWNVILTNPAELADAISEYEPTRECFKKVREELKEWWSKNKPIVERGEKFILDNPIKFVSMYYFNHQYSYGPMFLGWPSSVYLKEDVHKRIIKKVREFKCPNLKVKMGNFIKTIPKYSEDLLYVDPPYYDDPEKGNKLFKPLYPNCNFPIHHKGFEHETLRDLLYNHNGGFILSYNECPTIDRWYNKYERKYPSWHYSYAQGESRIGENRIPNYVPDEIKKEILLIDEDDSKETLKKRKNILWKYLKDDDKNKIFKKESHEILVINTKK